MKKLLISLTTLMWALATQAGDYTYLTFETTDGTKTSVDVSSLTLAISGTTLTAGGQSFTLANLVKMYFSSADESTGISTVTTADVSEATAVYDLNGRKVAADQMRAGVYIVKTRQGTYKLTKK